MNILELIAPVSLIIVGYIVIGILLYYIFIRTKFNKRKKEILSSYDKLKVGSKVVVLGGIFGEIRSITKETCEVELNRNNIITVSIYAITDIIV